MRVKIGVHTGDVISGVVGETKPQFSLIGDTVNKSSRVCSKCPQNKILISKETQKLLEAYSNNFAFEPLEVFMKGIGTEKTYKVSKRKMGGRGIREKTKVVDRQNMIRQSKSISPVREAKNEQANQMKGNLGQNLVAKDSAIKLSKAERKMAKSQTLTGTEVTTTAGPD